MARLDKLWREAGGPGLPPYPSSKRVKARVNAALDACRTERNVYMKQKWRTALVAAAVAAAITGTAFAAAEHWDMLTVWFKGDTAPGQEYVDSEVRSVSDENYTLSVESMAADEQTALMTVSITALSDEAKAFLRDEHFDSIDTFGMQAVSASNDAEEAPAPSGPSVGPSVGISFSIRNLEPAAQDSRRYALAVENLPADAAALRVRCGYMEEGKAVEVPIAPAAELTVKIGASGTGVLSFAPAEAVGDPSLTIREITLSPFTCHVYGSCPGRDVYPNLRFRMSDGTVLTQAQTMNMTSGNFDSFTHECDYHYRFQEVQDLNSIASVIVFDKEYPLDGAKPTQVEHDPLLDPFIVSRMEPLTEGSGYAVPVQELTEKLGGSYTWDAAAQTASCVYRDVTVLLKAGSATALVDGQEVEMSNAPAVRDGVLCAGSSVFESAWGIELFLQREACQLDGNESELIWLDWYIIP